MSAVDGTIEVPPDSLLNQHRLAGLRSSAALRVKGVDAPRAFGIASEKGESTAVPECRLLRRPDAIRQTRDRPNKQVTAQLLHQRLNRYRRLRQPIRFPFEETIRQLSLLHQANSLIHQPPTGNEIRRSRQGRLRLKKAWRQSNRRQRPS